MLLGRGASARCLRVAAIRSLSCRHYPSRRGADSGAAASRILVGTSGYNYAEWKGSFYPEKLSAKRMLPFYAERLSTVEINYTFYRIPTDRLLAGWSEVTPDHFRFTLKAPRRITHLARLRGEGHGVL